MNYTFQLRLQNKSNTPLPGVKITPVIPPDERLGECHTNEKGIGRLSFSSENFDKQYRGAGVMVTFYMHRNEEYIGTVRQELQYEKNGGENIQVELVLDVEGGNEKVEYTVHVSAKNKKDNSALALHEVEAWYFHPKKADELLGKALTDKSGFCKIIFERDSPENPSDFRPLYFKVYQGSRFVYDSKKEFKYWAIYGQQMEVVLPVPEREETTGKPQKRTLWGELRNNRGETVSGLMVQAFEQSVTKEIRVGTGVAHNGQYEIKYASTFPQVVEGVSNVDVILKIYAPDGKLLKEEIKARTKNNRQKINILGIDYPPAVEPIKTDYTLKGKIVNEKGEALSGVVVELFNQNIPGRTDAATAIGNPVLSCEDGSYEITVPYQEIKDKCQTAQPDITIKVSDGSGKELFSATQYNLEGELEVPVTISTETYQGQSEFDKLNASIRANLDGMDIKDVREDEQVKGISFLSEKTQLDSRTIEMSVAAHRFKDEAQEDISEGLFFTLFKSGVRTSKDVAYRVNVHKAMEQYGKAVEQNIIPDEGRDMEQMKAAFKKESIQHILQSKPPAGYSTMDEMLSLSLSDENDKKKFVDAYYHSEGDRKEVWDKVKSKLGAAKTKQLQLEGMIGYLTLNNAPLIKKLKSRKAFETRPLDLVKKGYYQKDKWNSLIGDNDIPEAFTGETTEERKENYKDWLTSELIRSYPTKVIAERVKSRELKVSSKPAIRNEVYAALYDEEEDFELGKKSINKHIEALEAKGVTLQDESKAALKQLHRISNLTSDSETMKVLLEKELDSAFKIAKYDQKRFLKNFSSDFGADEALARQVYNKAVNDASLITNLTMSYLTQRSNPMPAAVAPMIRNSPEASVKKYPTIENLFGSLDYCSCGHCESILSPAAYFVQLLEFLKENEYTREIDGVEHTITAQDVLLGNSVASLSGRRPDLESIDLTCENTNTVMPYIDLVNEILEHYIIHQSLDNFEGYNIAPNTPSEELLASPQHVGEAAYNLLKGEVYPLFAPFNRDLELMREYCQKMDIPLYQLMETMRKDNSMDNSPYGWRQIFAEQLNISRKELDIFTNSGYIGASPLHRLYGIDPSETLNDTIGNAKTFCRAVDIPYADLVRILKTAFINPASVLIPKLEILQAAFNKAKEDDWDIRSTYGSMTMFEVIDSITSASTDVDDIFPLNDLSDFTDANVANLKEWILTVKDDVLNLISLVPVSADSDICHFENFELKYADPNNPDLSDFEYWKFIRFIRLQQKLSMSYENTDKVIQALFDFENHDISGGDLGNFDAGFADMLIRIALLFRIKRLLRLNFRKDLEGALLFFGDLNLYTHAQIVVDNGSPVIIRNITGSVLNQNRIETQSSISTRPSNHNATSILDASDTSSTETRNIIQPQSERSRNNGATTNSQNSAASGNILNFPSSNGIVNPSPHQVTGRILREENVTPPQRETGTYQQAFNRISDLSLDQTFQPDSRGQFLTDPSKVFSDYVPIIQGATKLNERELRQTATRIPLFSTHDASGPKNLLSFQNIPLSSENISILFRHSYLAKALKISVEELLDLIDLFGVDPFDNLYNDAGIYKEPKLIQFIRLAQQIKNSDFKVQDLNYLLRHIDVTGNSSPSFEDIVSFGKTINGQLKEIEIEYNTEIKLEAAYKQDDAFPTLDAAIQAVSEDLIYDHDNGNLKYSEIMTADLRDSLKAVTGVSADFKLAIDNLYQGGQDKLNELFVAYPEMVELYEGIHTDTSDPNETLAEVVDQYLRPLVAKNKLQAIREVMSGQLGITVEMAQQFLESATEDGSSYILHSAASEDQPAKMDFLNMGKNGTSILYSNGSEDLAFSISRPINYSTGVMNGYDGSFQNGDPDHIIWRFYLEVPVDGSYDFVFDADGTGAVLKINGETIPIANTLDDTILFEGVELSAGQFYSIELIGIALTNKAIFKWKTEGSLLEAVPVEYYYPFDVVKDFRKTYLRLLKTIRLVQGFNFSERELYYFGNRDAEVGHSPFPNRLPLSKVAVADIDSDLAERFRSIMEYQELKNKLEIIDDTLIPILKTPTLQDENGADVLYQITPWDAVGVDELLTHFADVSALENNIQGFLRIADAFTAINQIGTTAADLIQWTTNDPYAAIITDFHRLLKSKYDERSWLDVIQPINDRMRGKQRDALVNYIIKSLGQNEDTAHIDTPDKLFEFFLIDVQMGACMKTSRIKQGISSIQLFIDRCLMNLEPLVDPAAIDAKQWEWMKNYRVWEAAVNIFLSPENWLDESLNSNKSPFFREFESELLQSDINDDLARTALMNYLEKLDKVAWLEVCGMCKEDDERVHIIGHTPGMNREYYHRVYDGTFSAWEKIDLDIEGGTVFPVFWKGRLFLFWTTIMIKGKEGNIKLNSENASEVESMEIDNTKVVEVHLNWSEYYNDKWQAKRTSNFDEPWIFYVPKINSLRFFNVYYVDSNGDLIVNLYRVKFYQHYFNYEYEISTGKSFRFYNKYSSPEVIGSPSLSERSIYNNLLNRIIEDYGDSLIIKNVNLNFIWYSVSTNKKLLSNFSSKRSVDIEFSKNIHNEPFFSRDSKSAFFIVPKILTYTINHYEKTGGIGLPYGVEQAATVSTISSFSN